MVKAGNTVMCLWRCASVCGVQILAGCFGAGWCREASACARWPAAVQCQAQVQRRHCKYACTNGHHTTLFAVMQERRSSCCCATAQLYLLCAVLCLLRPYQCTAITCGQPASAWTGHGQCGLTYTQQGPTNVIFTLPGTNPCLNKS